MTYTMPSSAPAYVDQTGPAISAAEMNWLDQKCRESVSLQDKGATGGSDDTTAIQAAFNTGNAYVPYGTWIYSSLTVPATGLFLWGPGTLKRKTTTTNPGSEIYTIDATGASNVTVLGVTFDGNKAGQSGSAGFKVSTFLLRDGSNILIMGCVFKNGHEDYIEITCATQSNPTNYNTPPADPSDTIYKARIIGNFFVDGGRNVDDGSGYSNSRCVQVGSTTSDVVIANNLVWNCIGGFQAAAYNRNLMIVGNDGYCDSSTLTYAGDWVAVEQLSTDFVVSGNSGRGWRAGYNIESVIGGVIAGNQASDVLYGIRAFASNIGATATDLGRLVITGNRIECRGTTSGTVGIAALLSSGHGAYDVTISGNLVLRGEKGIQVSGVTGGVVTGNYTTLAKTGYDVAACVKLGVTGNVSHAHTNEGFYFGAGNDQVTVSANSSKANGTYGCDVAASQTDLRIYDNDFDGANTTADFRITSYSNIKHDNNRYLTHSGTIKTLSGATPSVQYTGPTSYFTNGGATTVTALSNGRIGEAYRFIATNGNTTLQHGTNIFMRSHANFAMAANDAITLTTDDGTHWYEC